MVGRASGCCPGVHSTCPNQSNSCSPQSVSADCACSIVAKHRLPWVQPACSIEQLFIGTCSLCACSVMQDAECPGFNCIVEKCGFEGVTRFEDGFRLPLGIPVNFPSFAASTLLEVISPYSSPNLPWVGSQSRAAIDSCLDLPLSIATLSLSFSLLLVSNCRWASPPQQLSECRRMYSCQEVLHLPNAGTITSNCWLSNSQTDLDPLSCCDARWRSTRGCCCRSVTWGRTMSCGSKTPRAYVNKGTPSPFGRCR